MKNVLMVTAAVALLSACAQRPDAIAPVPMIGSYDGVSCQEALASLRERRAELSELESAQNGAATGDVIGVLMLGVPTSSVLGGDKSGEVAVAKGRVMALEERLSSCGEQR